MNEELKAKVLGAKATDKLVLAEGKNLLEIMEVYAIVEPQAPAEEAVPAPTETPST